MATRGYSLGSPCAHTDTLAAPQPHQMAERTSYPSYPPDSSPRGSFDQAPSNPFATPASEYTPVAARRYPAGYNNNSNMAYDNSGPLWSAGQAAGARAGGNKRKWWWVIGGIVALAIVLGAIIGGVVASQHKKSSSSSSSSSSSGSTSSGNTKGWVMSANNVVKYNPGDLSQFEKDPRLLPSMYGIAYSPAGSILPSCGASFDQVLEDVYLMSQLTTVSLRLSTCMQDLSDHLTPAACSAVRDGLQVRSALLRFTLPLIDHPPIQRH